MEGCGEGIALHDSAHSWAVDSSAEDQYLTGFGAYDEVLFVDGAFESAGLVGTLEVTLDIGAFLLKGEVLRRRRAVRVVAIERPFSFDVRRRLLRRGLLRPCGTLTENDQEP